MKIESKQDIGLWQFVGFGVTSLLGTLLHFLYDWTESPIAALFSGVNESTWEHMKLLFFPLFAFAILQGFFVGREYTCFWCIKLKGILLGLVLIPTLFYTLRGIFGPTPDWINITIFFVAAALTYLYETRLFKQEHRSCAFSKAALIVLCLIAVAFWVFTFLPPMIPLFEDPINGSFGI